MKTLSQISTDRNSRIDLHVHTCHSRGGGNWFLKNARVNESYTTPKRLYETATHRGMDFVTITDHDSIEGGLELAHHENFFLSEEVTAYFPHDGSKVHIVVLDITESQHMMLQELRFNLYELVEFLNLEKLVHFIAHPFFSMSEHYTAEHFEQLILLFKIFEIKNGGKQLYPQNLLKQLLEGLTPEYVWSLVEKHDITPQDSQPWIKYMVGGSDDHGGIMIGSPHTVVPKSENIKELLSFIATGKSTVKGNGGSPFTVAHSILSVAYQHHRQGKSKKISHKVANDLLDQLFVNSCNDRRLSSTTRTLLFFNDHVPFVAMAPRKTVQKQMLNHFSTLLRSHKELREYLQKGLMFTEQDHENLFFLINETLKEFLQETHKQKSLSLKDGLDSARFVLPLLIPYVIGFRTEYKDRPLMRIMRKRILGHSASCHVGVFADKSIHNLDENPKIKCLLEPELSNHARLSFFAWQDQSQELEKGGFYPVESIQGIKIPPILDILHHMNSIDLDTIYIHTLGPMGLLGIFIGAFYGIPVISHLSRPKIQYLYKLLHSSIVDKFVYVVNNIVQEYRTENRTAFALAEDLNIPANKIRMIKRNHKQQQETQVEWSI